MKMLSVKERGNEIKIIIIFIVMGVSYVMINDAGSRLMSGTRAYFSGQNHWMKAQKQASLVLVKYIQYEDEEYFSEFNTILDVIEGDKHGREMLDVDPPDYKSSYQGFLQGKNDPRDIPHMIWIYNYFSDFEPISNAVVAWKEGEEKIDELRVLGEDFAQLRQSGEIAPNLKEEYFDKVYELDEELSVIESNFSAAISEAGYLITDFVYWATITIGLFLTVIAGFITTYQVRNIRRWNEQIRGTDQKFKNVLENSRDVIYQMNLKTGKYEYMSPSVKNMTGYSAEEIMNGGPQLMLSLTHPEDLDRMMKELNSLEKFGNGKKMITDTEFRVLTKAGSYIWVNNKRSVVKNEKNEDVNIIGNVRDITERKAYVDALDASLKEKDMLLSEIHHRVKNNLSIVSSLIELQKGSLSHADEEAFQKIQSRIKSIALVHEKLYQTETLADVDLAEYIQDLTQMISSTYSTESLRVNIVEEMEPLVVNIKKAVPVGLICNELLNNCYKHAFKGRSKGEIRVTLKREEEKVYMTISDDGVGLPKDFDFDTQSSLGMTLLKALTRQVKGEIKFQADQGTRFTICFPLSDQKV
ncbi:MAG: histidine kinase dimerization/phosphoacceptor domain -containing protein [Balneolaceae bacterium]